MNENLLRICMRLYKEDHIGEDEFLEFIKELTKDEAKKGSGSIRSNLGSLEPLVPQVPQQPLITWKVGDILCDGSDNNIIKC